MKHRITAKHLVALERYRNTRVPFYPQHCCLQPEAGLTATAAWAVCAPAASE